MPNFGRLQKPISDRSAVFFLPEPPQDFDAMRDFRRHVGAGAREWSPELHGEYRRALAQREAALELAEIDEAPPLVTWRLEPVTGDDEEIAAAARSLLLAQSPLPLPKPSGTRFQHLNMWTAALEEAGILVMATSGGRVATSEMRAFSLYYDQLPVIMVNGSDAASARLLSLLHEYAHLILHTGGLCDTITDTRALDPDRQLEARCNAIAAAVLMPPDLVQARPDVAGCRAGSVDWSYSSLSGAAAAFGVSAETFARRLLTLNRITRDFYRQLRDEFLAAYSQDEERTASGGGNWYRTTARDLGKGFVRADR